MARGISSKLRGSIKVTSAAEEGRPGMPITLVPAKGSSTEKLLVKAMALARLAVEVAVAWGGSPPS